jgi:hypothetical protein
MRTLLFFLWLVVPAAGLAYHYGPGQERLQLDEAATHLEAARDLAAAEDHAGAVAEFDAALALLPAGDVEAGQRVRLERAKSQMLAKQLPEAREDLLALVDELQEEAAQGQQPDAELVRDARQTLASAHYYMTWLMRLEGQPREVWEPEIESARQNYRLLAESAPDQASQRGHQEDLAAAVRLARMDLSELQGLPLPSE